MEKQSEAVSNQDCFIGDFMQVKGKAAIDVVCNPLGKSGGALIQQFLILGFGSLAASTPYLGAILLVIVLAWLGAARSLDAQFTPLVQKDLKGKLLEGKLSAISAAVLGQSKARKEVFSFSLSVFVKVAMFRVVHCHQAHKL
jgi:hypothetical protein